MMPRDERRQKELIDALGAELYESIRPVMTKADLEQLLTSYIHNDPPRYFTECVITWAKSNQDELPPRGREILEELVRLRTDQPT